MPFTFTVSFFLQYYRCLSRTYILLTLYCQPVMFFVLCLSKVLVEFDDTGWKSREYIKVHDTFLVFLVEHTLSWVDRTNKNSSSQGQWPALVSPEHIYTLFLFVLFNHVMA